MTHDEVKWAIKDQDPVTVDGLGPGYDGNMFLVMAVDVDYDDGEIIAAIKPEWDVEDFDNRSMWSWVPIQYLKNVV